MEFAIPSNTPVAAPAKASLPCTEHAPMSPNHSHAMPMQGEFDMAEVLDGTSTCIFETEPDLRFSRFIGPVGKVTGLYSSQLVGNSIGDLAVDDGGPNAARGFAAMRAHQPYRDLVLQLPSPGGPRFIRLSGRPRLDDRGRFRGYQGLISDITSNVMAEREAATTHQRLAEALESVPASVMLFDTDDRLAFCNSATEHFFPKAAHLLVPGTAFEDLLRSDIAGGNVWNVEMDTEEWVRERMERHRVANCNLTGQRPDGSWVQVIERRTTDGATIGVRIDVTEAKNQEAELRQKSEALAAHSRELQRSNAELEQFAYVASHDLQEPLRMVASYCQLLQRRYQSKLDTDADEFIGFAVEGALRMQRLINDLLNYSRVGRRGNALAPVSMSEAASIALANLQRTIADSAATVEIGELPTITGDRAVLPQLLQNLIANAIKFRREEPPVVRVNATLEGSFWHFIVEDNGIGIEPEHLERVFLIFQRLHQRHEYPGTGIGLAIAKKVVEYHGGQIWIDSVRGQGSRFHFTLPADREEIGTNV
jgi:signal transduction histidine kinase